MDNTKRLGKPIESLKNSVDRQKENDRRAEIAFLEVLIKRYPDQAERFVKKIKRAI